VCYPNDVTQPAITYAIPFYSGVTYLARALRSILSQDDQHWLAYVCDDGAELGIEEIVKRFGDGRIRYSRNPSNLGMGRNFNRCIDLAETDLVTILHNDDELKPCYGAKILDAAKRYPSAVALFCRTDVIDENSDPRFSIPDIVKDVLISPSRSGDVIVAGEPGIRALLHGNFINAPTLCFRKSVLGPRRFAPAYKFVLDCELTSQLVFDGDTIVGIPDRCYRYRRHEEAATSKYTKTQLRFREESDYYDRMYARCEILGWQECAKLARDKRIVKLNVAYRSLKSLVLLDLDEAVRGFRLLRELGRV
jgi:glycosyltransferase involved in cell wall biosynthesis